MVKFCRYYFAFFLNYSTFARHFDNIGIRTMKKLSLKSVIMGFMLMMCATASAQSISSVLGNNTTSSGGSNLISNLTAIFSGKKQASAANIVGTWVYEEPAIVLKSDNVLTNAAAKIAANKMESILQAKLTTVGIKPGAMTMTFKQNGTFISTLKGKTTKGKWSVKDSKLQLTTLGVKSVSITTQLEGKKLMFVANSTKLLNLFKAFGSKSGNANLQTVSKLMKNVNGMEVGVTMKKK